MEKRWQNIGIDFAFAKIFFTYAKKGHEKSRVWIPRLPPRNAQSNVVRQNNRRAGHPLQKGFKISRDHCSTFQRPALMRF